MIDYASNAPLQTVNYSDPGMALVNTKPTFAQPPPASLSDADSERPHSDKADQAINALGLDAGGGLGEESDQPAAGAPTTADVDSSHNNPRGADGPTADTTDDLNPN